THSRIANLGNESHKPSEQEWLIAFCKEELQAGFYDYLIFGHRHLPLDIQLTPDSRYINLGEWINYNTYAVFDGAELRLEYFEKQMVDGS
ncbi:MAG TPA: UDP-2,3-diacylglucosamine diphosphatase, partial [Mucilaginibacter sp.]